MPEAYQDPYGEAEREYVSSHLWYEANRDDSTPIALNRELFAHERD